MSTTAIAGRPAAASAWPCRPGVSPSLDEGSGQQDAQTRPQRYQSPFEIIAIADTSVCRALSRGAKAGVTRRRPLDRLERT